MVSSLVRADSEKGGWNFFLICEIVEWDIEWGQGRQLVLNISILISVSGSLCGGNSML
jgi:hypothetical protein